MAFKFGPPVELPPIHKRADYGELWAAVIAARGEWIPVECDRGERALIANAARSNRKGFVTRTVKDVLYIRCENASD
jgi:hypothetical protein